MSPTTEKAKMRAKPEKWDKSHFPVSVIRVASENDLLYDRFGVANRDDADLAISIRDKGIQEPLTISKDDYLLSGHRRLAAAKYLGLETVPCRVVDVYFLGLSTAERLEALRLYNRQREKSPGERIKEKLRSHTGTGSMFMHLTLLDFNGQVRESWRWTKRLCMPL